MESFGSYPPPFIDRHEAGRLLAEAVARQGRLTDPIVLALPRGGVPVGFELARRLRAPLEVLIVRKVGAPGEEELALGAVASGGAEYWNANLITELRLSQAEVDRIRERERAEVERRSHRYRGDLPWPDLRGRSVIVVDDGAATGATALAAIAALRPQTPAELIMALPVAPPDTCERLRAAADCLVCLRSPGLFLAIGIWYRDFGQVSDDEVTALLRSAAAPRISQEAAC
ncbi:MAG: phosphoribosyltransferase [Candidatus Limnocylindria bacterium]